MKYYILVDPSGRPCSQIYKQKGKLVAYQNNYDPSFVCDIECIDSFWKRVKYFWWYNKKVY